MSGFNYLSCCGTVITEVRILKGHSQFHLDRKEEIPCPHSSCNKVFSTCNNLVVHISSQHRDVPKHIIGLEEPPKINMFKMMEHSFQKNIPLSSRNVFSSTQYKLNQINEQYIDDLNNVSRSENEEIINRMVNELDESIFSDQPVEEQLNPDLFECEFESILSDESRQDASNIFDRCNLDQQLSDFQKDLADGYNQVKDSNVITDTALKFVCDMMIDVFSKHLNLNQLIKKQAQEIIKSDYLLQKRRNAAKYRCKKFEDQEKVYYFDIRDYLERMVKNDLIWRKLLNEKHKRRDDNLIETVHDLDKVKEIDRSIGEKEINVFYNLWFDDFNTSTRTFGNTNLSAVLLSMASIEYKFTTRRHSAGLVALSKKSTRDKVSIYEYFRDIREQIKNMQPIQHNGYIVYFRFFCVKADNKAANEMIINIAKSFTRTAALNNVNM